MIQPKRNFKLFAKLKFFSDIILIPFIVILAYGLKFKLGWVLHNVFYLPIGDVYKNAQLEPFIGAIWVFMIVWAISFLAAEMYSEYIGIMPQIHEGISIIKGITYGTLAVAGLTFFMPTFPQSRYLVIYAWAFGIIIIGFNHWCLNKIKNTLQRRGYGVAKALVIGADPIGQDIVERMMIFPSMKLQYMGSLDSVEPDTIHFHLRNKLKMLGSPEAIEEILEKERIDVIFVTRPKTKSNFIRHLRKLQNRFNFKIYVLSKDHQIIQSLGKLTDFDGLPFVLIPHAHELPWHYGIKCALDRIAAALLLMLLSPILICIAILIKLVSPHGPVLFSQERVGYKSTIFKMIKFRTMIPDAEKHSGPVMVNESGDNRYIPFGGFLRKTSLDELPQLINIIKGEMSFVGPRPERPYFVEKFKKTVPHFDKRHLIKGGITGWAQINGRSVLTRRPDQKLKYDLYYIKNWSLMLDIKIILKTISVVFKQEEAY